MSELKAQLKSLQIRNRQSLRTSEHLAIRKQIASIKSQIEDLK